MSIIGIDVSKRFHVAHCDGLEWTFSHSQRGFNAFVKWLREQGITPSLIGMEPTGRYTKTLADWLSTKGYQVVMVPGVHVNRMKRIMDYGVNKTDRIDAKVIAELVKMGRYSDRVAKSTVFKELRHLSNLYFHLVRAHTQEINRLHALVDQVFPELTRYIGLDSMTALSILKRYESPSQIAAEPFESFLYASRQGHTGRGRQIALEKMRELHRIAGDSIGEGGPSAGFEISYVLDALKLLKANREEVKEQISGWLACVDYGDRLLDVPGITPVTAGLVLGEIGDLQGYSHIRQIWKTAGVNIVERSSGQFQSRRFISKEGRPMLRTHLFNIALRHCTQPKGAWYDWYKAREGRKPAKVLLIATVRRLLKYCYVASCSAERSCESRLA